MDVIGSFMARDVFVAATSESRKSVISVEEWESSQREAMTDSPGQVDFPSWRLTLYGHFVRRLDDAVHPNCLLVNCSSS